MLFNVSDRVFLMKTENTDAKRCFVPLAIQHKHIKHEKYWKKPGELNFLNASDNNGLSQNWR